MTKLGGGAALVLSAGALSALVAPRAAAVDPSRAMSQYVHDVWTTARGLPQDSVNAIVQTRDGYLWVATQEGVARFDGVTFTVFDRRSAPGLTRSFVNVLLEDRDGSLWLGTEGGGLSRLKDGRVTTLTREAGLAADSIQALAQLPDGSLWVGTPSGLSRVEKGTVTTFRAADGLPDEAVWAVQPDSDGTVWIGTHAGLCRLRGGRIEKGPDVGILSGDSIRSILPARRGGLWLGGDRGIVRWDGRVVETHAGAKGVRQLYEDGAGTLWIGTAGNGVARLAGGVFSRFRTVAPPAEDGTWGFCEDHEGSLWFGSQASGLHRFRDGRALVWGKPEGLPDDHVWPLLEDAQGTVWIGSTHGGLARLQGGAITVSTGLPGEMVNALWSDPDGTLWAGFWGVGIAQLRAGKVVRLFTARDGLRSLDVSSLRRDRSGTLWAGTAGRGIARLSGETWVALTKADGLVHDYVTAIAEDTAGKLWVATAGGGLSSLGDGAPGRLTRQEGLSSDEVQAVVADTDGSLWIGTGGGGLCRARNGRVDCWGTKDGLPDDVVLALVPDARGGLWLGSNRGVVRVAKSDLARRARGELSSLPVEVFGTADGMRSQECNGGASSPTAFRGRDGRVWFSTAKGAVVFDPGKMPRNDVPPQVRIEAVLADGRSLAPSSGTVEAGPGVKSLELRFTALSFRAPERVRFRYRLEGVDDGWVEAGTRRAAYYTNVPHGRRTFLVTAGNDDGVFAPQPASLGLLLRPRLHETWWVQGLALAALAAVAHALYLARLAQLSRRQHRLEAQVEERTRDLAALLGKLTEAQERIDRLQRSSAEALRDVAGWARAMTGEVARAVGAREIAVFALRDGEPSALTGSGAAAPSREALALLASRRELLPSGEAVLVPVSGLTGDLVGVLAVVGVPPLGETERRLLGTLARQLGGALEMARLNEELAGARERRALRRRELAEAGVEVVRVCPACDRCYGAEPASCPADGALLEERGELPLRVRGRYRLVRVLGQGGMGTVFAARDEKLERDVAIKVIRPELFGKAEMRLRFEQEARAVARIQHPGVLALFDSGELDDGSAFLVTELLRGLDLADLLERHGAGTPRQVGALVRQAGAALEAAHRAGLVHRDVKPGNLFLVDALAGFVVKVLDFGLAKPVDADSSLTRTGAVVGTPAYMSPEQLLGRALDPRGDLYSLAAVAFEALTGRQLVRASEFAEVCAEVLYEQPPSPSSFRAPLGPEVDRLFAEALAKDRNARPASVSAWAAALGEALGAVEDDGGGWPRPLSGPAPPAEASSVPTQRVGDGAKVTGKMARSPWGAG